MKLGREVAEVIQKKLDRMQNEDENWVVMDLIPDEPMTLETLSFWETAGEAAEICALSNRSSHIWEIDQRAAHSDFMSIDEFRYRLTERTDELSIKIPARLASHSEREILINQKTNTMNMKNFEFLRDQVKYLGFGDSLEATLKTKLESGDTKFELTHEREFDERKVVSQLEFNRSKESDMYFFNGYKVTTTPENQKEAMTQHFYVNHKGQNVTLKEAYNLMNGRAVFKQEWSNKENQLYPAWLKLDFTSPDDRGNFKLKPYNENYGFKLDEAVSKHPEIKIVGEAAAQQLAKDLQRGNRVPVTISKDGASAQIYIEASPTTHGLNVYDANMKLLPQRQKTGQAEGAGQKNNEAETQKNNKKQRQHH